VNINKLQSVLFKEISGCKSFKDLEKAVFNTKDDISITGLAGSSLAFIIAALAEKSSRPILIVTSKRDRAYELFDDLEFFGLDSLFHFPAWEILPYETDEPHTGIAVKQLDTLEILSNMKKIKSYKKGSAPVIVASVEALFQKIISVNFYESKCIRLNWGDEVTTEDLAEKLVDAGYTRMPLVESRGEFGIRGGIIDIFPLTVNDPIRLDLFGNEIESIRIFDAYTQRSQKLDSDIEDVIIPPAKLSEMIHKSLEDEIPLVTIFESIAPDALLVFDEDIAFESRSKKFEELVEHQYFEISAKREEHISPDNFYTDWDALSKGAEKFQVISHTLLPVETSSIDTPIRFHTASFHDLRPSLDDFMGLISQKQKEDFIVNVVCDNEGQVQRFDELLRERELSAVEYFPEKPECASWSLSTVEGGLKDIVLSVGALHEGFLIPDAKVVFVTDREIFGRYKRRHIYRKTYKGSPVSAPSDMKRGDFIVHEDHGIGKFVGIRTQNIDNRNVDLIELVYAKEAKLLVPVDRIGSIQKYSVVENIHPKLDELGSKRWLTRKKKTQEKIEEMAGELLDLYAKRELAKGLAYGSDTVWQSEFEASFIYQETPDQLTAIHQVKKDLQSDKPMDRLVCGDVGYGKTEVSLRAAFKVVQEGKQVAILAPTTILCQQHFNTFSERFAEYPFKVEMLSRFRTKAQQNKILQKLKNGEVHILVGTHRLLSKDIEFFDLGLVVVDEEQRFGVRHKERLKELRSSIDFLTLTATPIPRTLYMALSGIRDLSIINTPPPNRLPIKTSIIHWDDEMIREAILRELNRGGQIFFVHNRIHNIEKISERLNEIVPNLKIAIAHGRLNEHELERVMLEFVDRKYDLLLSTAIIENGLDIPNVNTIIINRADAFGLAQLYQLRGRVGRDVKRAYAYLLTPSGQPITDTAVKRLAAIEEFTELGIGFNIAMRDLEIRGSGNLLGKEQHGCIVSVGFDMYCTLLDKTVKRIKGETLDERAPVEIKWKLESFLPASYIPVEMQRVGVYKRLSEAKNIEKIQDIREELKDRYGDVPDPVENILKVAELKMHGSKLGIKKIVLTNNGYKLSSDDLKNILDVSDLLHRARKEIGDNLAIKAHDETTLHVLYPKWDEQPRMEKAVNLLNAASMLLP
jgi:transcription-repair coupling factor (superfamily II helicase)